MLNNFFNLEHKFFSLKLRKLFGRNNIFVQRHSKPNGNIYWKIRVYYHYIEKLFKLILFFKQRIGKNSKDIIYIALKNYAEESNQNPL